MKKKYNLNDETVYYDECIKELKKLKTQAMESGAPQDEIDKAIEYYDKRIMVTKLKYYVGCMELELESM